MVPISKVFKVILGIVGNQKRVPCSVLDEQTMNFQSAEIRVHSKIDFMFSGREVVHSLSCTWFGFANKEWFGVRYSHLKVSQNNSLIMVPNIKMFMQESQLGSAKRSHWGGNVQLPYFTFHLIRFQGGVLVAQEKSWMTTSEKEYYYLTCHLSALSRSQKTNTACQNEKQHPVEPCPATLLRSLI